MWLSPISSSYKGPNTVVQHFAGRLLRRNYLRRRPSQRGSDVEALKTKFPTSYRFSATPLRADGQLMAGRILYSFPISRAIQDGYVKRMKALVLIVLPARRRHDGLNRRFGLAAVRRLGEQDADFRRCIVTSSETLNTIVDASIRELDRIRQESGDDKHKIIASALNLEHCRQSLPLSARAAS